MVPRCDGGHILSSIRDKYCDSRPRKEHQFEERGFTDDDRKALQSRTTKPNNFQ
jgi:hypothetical protein